MANTFRKFMAVLVALTLCMGLIAIPAAATETEPAAENVTVEAIIIPEALPAEAPNETAETPVTEKNVEVASQAAANARPGPGPGEGQEDSDTLDHIDVRIDGTLTMDTAVDGVIDESLQESYEIEVIESPDVTYTDKDGNSENVALSGGATQDPNTGGNDYEYTSDRNNDYEYGSTVTLDAVIQYEDKDGKTITVNLDYEELMTEAENACEGRPLGYDVVIEATQLTELVTEKTTVVLTKVWSGEGEKPESITLCTESSITDKDGNVLYETVTLTPEHTDENGNWVYTITSVSVDEDISIYKEEGSYEDEETGQVRVNGTTDEEGNLTGYWVVTISEDGKTVTNTWVAIEPPTDPTDPPTDPTDPPTDPTDPPTDPTDPPTDPTDPPTDPTDPPTDPTDPPTDPTDPPTDPTDPPTDPTDPPTDPTDPPTDPTKPSGPSQTKPPVETDPPATTPVTPHSDVPRATAPKTGDLSLLWAAISGLSLGGMVLIGRKEDEE